MSDRIVIGIWFSRSAEVVEWLDQGKQLCNEIILLDSSNLGFGRCFTTKPITHLHAA